MSSRRMALLAIVTLSMLVTVVPGSMGTPVVIDSFEGGVTEASLTFYDSLVNGTLRIELPRGADILDAELGLEGLPAMVDPPSNLSFANGERGKNIWAYWEEGRNMYPPTVNPRGHNWYVSSEAETNQTKKDDGIYWLTETDDPMAGRPPGARPFQLYRFKPASFGADNISVHWNGWSTCSMNRTKPYNAEMYLYHHTTSKWVKVASYARGGNRGDDWMNYTFDLPSPYMAADRSIDVMIVGCRSEWAGPMLPGFDQGYLYTDFIKVQVHSAGGLVHPSDISLTVDGTDVVYLPGDLDSPVTVGDPHGFADSLQQALDQHSVMPGNVSLRCVFSVGNSTSGRIWVGDLRIEYEPVVNEAPSYAGPASASIEEDGGWAPVLDLDAAFFDDHNQGELTFSQLEVLDPPSPGPEEPVRLRIVTGTSGNRTLEAEPEADFFTLEPLNISITATDLFDASVEGRLELTVLPTGDRPELVVPSGLEARERSQFNHTFEVVDPDLPDDELTFSDDSPYLDIDPTTGEVQWTPEPHQVGVHEFRVNVTDRYGLRDTEMVRITVLNVPDAPTIVSELEIEATQGVEVTYIIRVDDPDLSHGDEVTFSAFADAIDLEPDPDTGRMTFTPTNDHVPSFTVTLRVEDSFGLMDERVLVVLVANVNDPPVFVQLESQSHDQSVEVTVTLSATDPDLGLDLPEPEALTFTGSGEEAFLPDEDGTITFTADQSLVGEHQVTYTVTDRAGLKSVMVVTWTIIDVNDAPEIVTDLPDELLEDDEVSVTMSASDPDGDTMTWSDDSDLFDVDPLTGAIVFTPLQEHVGEHAFTITATDGNGGTAALSHTFTVVNVNDAPTITGYGPPSGSTFEEGEAIDLSAEAVDEDGDDLTFTWTEGGRVLGTGPDLRVEDLSAGRHTLTLEVTDGKGGTATQAIELDVTSSLLGPAMASILIAVVIAVIAVAAVLVMRSRRQGVPPPGDEGQM